MKKPNLFLTQSYLETTLMLNPQLSMYHFIWFKTEIGQNSFLQKSFKPNKSIRPKILDNFSEKLVMPQVEDSYERTMEEAIANYRGAAEQTFEYTMPEKAFRDGNEATGIFLRNKQ